MSLELIRVEEPFAFELRFEYRWFVIIWRAQMQS